jgi:hypothetical protein
LDYADSFNCLNARIACPNRFGLINPRQQYYNPLIDLLQELTHVF